MSPFLFIIISLVNWRITHLLSKEDGPFDIVFFLRKKAGAGFFGNLLDCFYCVSVWVALPFGFYTGNNWKERFLYWLAFSAAACLMEQATGVDKHKNQVTDYKED